AVFPRRTVSAGKREIGRIPVFGWFYRLSGNLVIDRAHARSAHDALEAAAQAMAEEKISVWFMPEGHRNTSGTLLPFKSGAFRLAGPRGRRGADAGHRGSAPPAPAAGHVARPGSRADPDGRPDA